MKKNENVQNESAEKVTPSVNMGAVEVATPTQLTVPSTAEVAWNPEDDSDNVTGMEYADTSSISLPRVIVMQPTSPALTAEGSELKMGDIINTLTLEKLTALRFIPIMIWDSNILFTPREDKPEDKARLGAYGFTDDDFQAGNVLCNAKDGKEGDRRGACAKCGLNRFNGNIKPICNSTVNVLAMFDFMELPVIIQFAATSKKHGDKLKQMIMFSGGACFKKAYKLTAMRKTATGNKVWYELVAAPGGNVTDEEYTMAKGMAKAMLQSQDSWRNAEHDAPEYSEPTVVVDENKEY